MNNLQHRQTKIQDVRKQTPWRQFLKEIVSLRSLSLYKNNWHPSVYPDTDRIKWVVSHAEFEASRDALTQHGHDYDLSRNFFDNFTELFRSIDQPPTRLFETCDNCEYSDQTVGSRNCYLSYVTIVNCENVLYSMSVKESSTNVFNSLLVWTNCENIYYSVWVINSFNIFHSKYINNCSNVWFSENLIWCSECIQCNNLQNQSYCINNQQYSKEDYQQQKTQILSQKSQFAQYYQQLSNHGNNIASTDVTGNFNIECQDIQQWYYNYQIKQWRNMILIGGKWSGEHVYDCFLNTPPQNHYYGTFSAWYGDHIYNSYHIKWGSNVYYSVCMENSSYCIGCVWLRNKEFCILNKQYSKEEWYEQADKIFAQMEQDGILGKFFPWSLHPFYFNDSAAYLIDDSFTKEEVTAEGYLRRDEEIKVDIPDWMEVVESKNLWQFEWRKTVGTDGNTSDKQWTIDPIILKKTIRDEEWNIYRIIKLEYDFLVKYWLPLPRKHWLTRMKENFRIT